MNFVNYAEMARDAKELALRLPPCDAVVGIPRSGLLPAAVMANALGVRLGVMAANGPHFIDGGARDAKKPIKRVVVIDDSVDSGAAMTKARESMPHWCQAAYACLYVTPGSEKLVDMFWKALPQPRMFEWNYSDHGLLIDACIDIDGVLCDDPSEEQNDDGEKYRLFIRNARPRIRPKRKMGWLVTSRLEKYRTETLIWLSENGFQFENLVMAPYVTKEERMKADAYAELKAQALKASGKRFFIESDDATAKRIHSRKR
jgi:orotate phosphoribosyltransferase